MTKVNRRRLHLLSWAFAVSIGAYGIYGAWEKGREDARKDAALAIAEAKVARAKADTLAAHDQALDALHDSVLHGYAELDEQGRVIEWNPALEKWTGFSEAEMLGRDILALMPADKRANHARGYSEMIGDPKALGKTYIVQCELQPRDPSKKPMMVRVNARIVQPADGKRYAVAIIDREQKVVELTEEKS